MKNFDSERHGYNKSQVDFYINNLEGDLASALHRVNALEGELAEIQKSQQDYKMKSQNISIALSAAVEKAKQIENSSRNVYKLKIQQLELLYNKWESLLSQMIKKYPDIKDIDNVKSVMQQFKQSIKSTLKDDFKVTTFSTSSDNDPIRVLLSRMNEHLSRAPSGNTRKATIERNKLSKDILETKTELERLEEKAPIIKPIYSDEILENERYETLADKFLTEEPEDTIYAQKFGANSYPNINESGFDLKEAVNPKDDLEEIMKSFDFFNENEDRENS